MGQERLGASQGSSWPLAQAAPRVRRPTLRERSWTGWLTDPRNAVLLALGGALLVGGGRRLIQARKARAAVDRLGQPGVTPAEVLDVANYRRAGIMELFRLLGTAPDPDVRDAAGQALAILWANDELIPEEEKAVVLRGFTVAWRGRKRYPRGLRRRFTISAEYGVPFLRKAGEGVLVGQVEWSHRLLGAQRASLETLSPWRAGPGHVAVDLDPADFATLGPHRLVLQTRARPRGLTSTWELDLPHIPFPFEFDPNLAVEALLTLPDDARGEILAKAVSLVSPTPDPDPPRFLDLCGELVVRNPPLVGLRTPLPCDLAHRIEVEFESVSGRYGAGDLLLSGQGEPTGEVAGVRTFPLGPIQGFAPGTLERPGEVRMRAILTADPELGWADPDIRSLWPGTLTTDWVPVRIIRR